MNETARPPAPRQEAPAVPKPAEPAQSAVSLSPTPPARTELRIEVPSKAAGATVPPAANSEQPRLGSAAPSARVGPLVTMPPIAAAPQSVAPQSAAPQAETPARAPPAAAAPVAPPRAIAALPAEPDQAAPQFAIAPPVVTAIPPRNLEPVIGPKRAAHPRVAALPPPDTMPGKPAPADTPIMVLRGGPFVRYAQSGRSVPVALTPPTITVIRGARPRLTGAFVQPGPLILRIQP